MKELPSVYCRPCVHRLVDQELVGVLSKAGRFRGGVWLFAGPGVDVGLVQGEALNELISWVVMEHVYGWLVARVRIDA